MKKTKYRILAALLSAAFCLTAFSVPAFAQSSEPAEETVTETPAPEDTTTAKPFTPDGTGTVMDNATDEDGKEFYTITTPDENVFYLIIDNQREDKNVYFLNAVTEQDLMALAEAAKEDDKAAVPEVCTCKDKCEAGAVNTDCALCSTDRTKCLGAEKVTEEVKPEQTAQASGTSGIILIAVLGVALLGGAALWFFKFRKPKANVKGPVDLDDYEFEDDEEEDTPDEVEISEDIPDADEEELE